MDGFEWVRAQLQSRPWGVQAANARSLPPPQFPTQVLPTPPSPLHRHRESLVKGPLQPL